MSKKNVTSTILLAGGLALATMLSACGSSDDVASVEAQDGSALQEMLLTADESGLTDATAANDTVLAGESIPLVVVAEAEKFDGACGDALRAAEAAELSTVGSAARNLDRGDGTGVAVALFSVEDTDLSPADLYRDIAESCTDPIRDEETGAEYTFTPLDSDVSGFGFDITVTPGNESSSVMMLEDLGHHHVLVAGLGTAEDEVKQVFDAQVDKATSALLDVNESA